MKYFLRVFLELMICSMPLFAQVSAQNIHFSTITSTQGLSQNTVNCVLQDRRGFLWFGTANGLNRYDGRAFKIYRNELTNKNSLSNNYVISLLEDRQGYIWVGTYGGGLNRMNPDTGEFVRFQHKKSDPASIASNDIRVMYEDKSGKIWLGLYGGAFSCLDPVTQQIKRFALGVKEGKPYLNRVLTFVPDQEKGFWVGRVGGLFYFDRAQGIYTKRLTIHKDKQKGGFRNMVYYIFRDHNEPHMLWLCTIEAGLLKFNTRTNQIEKRWEAGSDKKTALKTNAVMSFHQDKQGTYWVGTQQGFYKFVPQTNQFYLFDSDPQNPRKIAGNNIQRIFEDKAGTLWLCSFKRGVSSFNPYIRNFAYYPLREKQANQVNTFCEDQEGNIWFATKGGKAGFTCFNRQNQTFKAFQPSVNNQPHLALNDINNLLMGVNGNMWIGATNDGLYRYDPKTKTLENCFSAYTKSWNTRFPVGALYQNPAKADELWVGTRGYGLFKFDKESIRLKKYVKRYSGKTKHKGTRLSHPTVIAIAKDYKGNLWLATRGGLSRLNPLEEVFTNYFHSAEKKVSISDNYVSALHIDKNDVLWVGTHNGLNRLNLKDVYRGKVVFKHYTIKQGLPDNIIHKIIEDATGKLWLSTSKGLSCFDKTKEAFKNYDEQDGLQGNEFVTNSGLLASDGTILMGGTNGFNLFHPEKLNKNTYPPPVVFTDFKIANQSVEVSKKGVLKRPVWASDIAVLSYQDKVISVEFAALNYILPAKNRYAVWLENYDQGWQYQKHQYATTYTGLSPGIYTLRVKAANNDGVWSKKEAKLVIVIKAPWWQRWWFRLSVAGVLLLGCVAGYYLVKQMANMRNKLSGKSLDKVTMPYTSAETSQASPSLNVITSPKKLLKDQDEIAQLKQKLQEVVVDQKLYREEAVSLNSIAEKMGITNKKLSELFNKELHLSFHDYINGCRVEEFKSRVEKGDAGHLKLISIAYESGFHSKSTFNRIFKKHTGLTPSEYKDQVSKPDNNV